MYTIISNCPKCGAPIYTYTVWHAVIPPPNFYSCACVTQQYEIITGDTSI